MFSELEYWNEEKWELDYHFSPSPFIRSFEYCPQGETMNIINRIVKWNQERLLDQQPFDLNNEITNIVEEIVEMTTGLKSDAARQFARTLIEKEFSGAQPLNKIPEEDIIDAFCDIIVYSIGAILKLKYNPECCMEETLKEIESRIGKIIDGKFVKDKSPEAQANWYKANYKMCKND